MSFGSFDHGKAVRGYMFQTFLRGDGEVTRRAVTQQVLPLVQSEAKAVGPLGEAGRVHGGGGFVFVLGLVTF